MTQLARRFVIIVLSLVLTLLGPLAVLETSARQWVAAGLVNWNTAALDDDYTAELHRERFDPVRTATWDYDGGYAVWNDYAGQSINQRDGVRVTTDQPAAAPHTLYLFGNSVVYGVTVSDRNTIPSALQRLTHDYRVINEGGIGAGTLLYFNKVRALPLMPGDVVLYFSGIDEMLGLSKLAHGENGDLIARLCQSLTLVACTRYTLQTPPLPLLNPAWVSEHLWQTWTGLYAALHRDNDYVQARQARLIWMLQPDVFGLPLSAGEAAMTIDAGDRLAVIQARPSLQMLVQTLCADGVEAYDFSAALDGLRLSGHEVFNDFVHLNVLGNRAVAAAMLSVVHDSRCTAVF